MCMMCSGSWDFQVAKDIGYIAPEMIQEELLRRMKLCHERALHPETLPEVQWDRRGLVWSDGKVLINVYEARRHAELAEKYRTGEITHSVENFY
jgi:hypothetical protein